ncbi:uncharacterized protein LOC127247968 [Andrographis paniculata]|uniref:uncharacterized protein LOC127247968 n=1 Tax=Andrographis paniculata TaxID=175694 RepID=UPI0021E7FD69|nr:uncharacterized protein LOC127247968 [Andrographis paniculata]
MGVEGAVKVVIIETQYVETDALSFKSVVQTLTGNHAAAANRPLPPTIPPPMQPQPTEAASFFDLPPVLDGGVQDDQFRHLFFMQF